MCWVEVVGLGKQEMGQEGGNPSDWLGSTFYFLWLVQCWKQDKKKGSQCSLTKFWQSWTGYYGNSESEFCCQMWSGHCLRTQYVTAYSVYQCVCVCVCVYVLSHSVVSDSLCPHGNSSGKNTGVGCHALLQGIFPIQGSNPGLLHCRWILYHLSHQGSPQCINTYTHIYYICTHLVLNLMETLYSKNFV